VTVTSTVVVDVVTTGGVVELSVDVTGDGLGDWLGTSVVVTTGVVVGFVTQFGAVDFIAAGVVLVIALLGDVLADAEASGDIESVGSVIALPVSLDDGAGSELTDTAAAVDFGEPPLEMM